MYFVHPQIKLNSLARATLSLVRPPDLKKLNQKLLLYFPERRFIFTDMGRSAFKVIIEKCNLENSEIIFPAYICDIFYPILKQYNIKPIFLDIDLKTFNIRPEEIKNKITPKTKAILVCHTYGLPLDIQKIRETGLLVIEDCAHSFGAPYRGNVAFFSLYKQFPTLRGGILVCPKDWSLSLPKTSFNLRDFISFLNCFSPFTFFFKKFGGAVAPKMVRKEKLSIPAGINRASLRLFVDFLDDFEKSLAQRKKLALFFQRELENLGFEVQESKDNVFTYLSALVPENLKQKRDKIVKKLRNYGIFCTRIWQEPIIMNSELQKEYQINLTEFDKTIEAAKRIINFPLQNHYREKDIKKMAQAIEKTLTQI